VVPAAMPYTCTTLRKEAASVNQEVVYLLPCRLIIEIGKRLLGMGMNHRYFAFVVVAGTHCPRWSEFGHQVDFCYTRVGCLRP
jgi:hypothetical protein